LGRVHLEFLVKYPKYENADPKIPCLDFLKNYQALQKIVLLGRTMENYFSLKCLWKVGGSPRPEESYLEAASTFDLSYTVKGPIKTRSPSALVGSFSTV